MISLHITSKNIHNTLYIVTYEDSILIAISSIETR